MHGVVGNYKKVGISRARPFYFSIVTHTHTHTNSEPLLCLNNLGLSKHVVWRLISAGLIGGQNEKGENFFLISLKIVNTNGCKN